MREKIQRFMMGRYGNDRLNQFLMIVAVILMVISLNSTLKLTTLNLSKLKPNYIHQIIIISLKLGKSFLQKTGTVTTPFLLLEVKTRRNHK